MRPVASPGSGDMVVNRAAPMGPVVALVMTDIEGSTALWERAPEAMARALHVHNGLMRAKLAEHGGYEIKSEGDAFALAFGEARAALAWCVEVQEALYNTAWPDALRGADDRPGLRSRMGLHVGEPLRHDDPVTGRTDYLGPPMNRVARVTASGHGGQVLLSEAAWTALREDLPSLDLEIEDLGVFTLRGLGAPERLRAVHRRGHRRRFPPLRASRWRPSSPLAGRDQFVGRAEDLAALHARFEAGARLITLKGPGGTGKTRLARRYGAEQEPTWPGGVVFCDLTEASTSEAVVAAVGRALGLSATADEAAIGAALAGRERTLLILDNLEQVASAAAPHVARWAQGPGPSALLLTSRVPLRLPDEQVLSVAPLSLPPPGASAPDALLASEAAELFVERAAERGAPLTLGPKTCADIAALVRRLDGLPLAIELAAAWARLMGPAAILERVAVHLDPLRRGADGRTPRQATLRAVVGWSWELLAPWEQAAFAQLSVFEGGFSVEHAEHVVAFEPGSEAPPVAEVLDRLVDHSLLTRGEVRGQLALLATLQDFARQRLDATPGARAAAERRHCAAYAALVRRVRRSGVHAGNAPELRSELDNLLTATHRAIALGDAAAAIELGTALIEQLQQVGPITEAVRLARLLAALPQLDGAQRTHTTLTLGNALRQAGHLDEARPHLERGLVESLALADPTLNSRAYMVIGLLEHDARNFDLARNHYRDALRWAEGTDALSQRATLHTILGHVEREQGFFDEAERNLRASLAWCPPQDRWTHRRALSGLALLLAERGLNHDAAHTLRELVALARADGDRAAEVIAAGNLSGALAELGQLDEAIALVRRTLTTVRALGNPRLLCINLGNLGDMLVSAGQLDEAEPALREAVSLAHQTGSRDAEGAFRGALGELLMRRGEAQSGWAELEIGAGILTALTSPMELLRLRLRQIRMSRATGRPVGALRDEARALFQRLGLTETSPLAREIEGLRDAL